MDQNQNLIAFLQKAVRTRSYSDEEGAISQALIDAYTEVYGHGPTEFDFWDFGTNGITPVAHGVPTIGFGPGPYKLAHMTNEHTTLAEVELAFEVYKQLIVNL